MGRRRRLRDFGEIVVLEWTKLDLLGLVEVVGIDREYIFALYYNICIWLKSV